MSQTLRVGLRVTRWSALAILVMVSAAISAGAQTISIDGVAGPSPVTVAAGTAVPLTVTDGPGNAGDWVGLFAAGGDTRLAYYYLSGTGSRPATGLTSATFTTYAPLNAGQYEWRLFVNDSWTRIATSGAITVTASPATLRVNGNPSAAVAAGAQVSLSVADGPGNAGDWVGLFPVGGDTRLAYYYLNGTGSKPVTGVTSATFPAYAPATAGEYEWRLFLNDSWSRIATSGVLTVTSPATLRVNGVAAPGPVTVVAGTQVALSVSDGPGNARDWVGLFPVGSDARIAYYYLNGTGAPPATGVTSAAFPTYAPLTAGQYEWRLFANDSWSRVATSGVITVSPSPATLRFNGAAAPGPVTVAAGTQVSLSVADGPGNAADWVGLFPVGGNGRISYYYLNGTGSRPATGVTSATFATYAPSTAGEYEWRLFLNDSWSRIATSGVLTVTSPATLRVNGVAAPGPVTVVAGTQVSLSVSDGPANARDWVGLFPVGSDARIAYYYLNGTGSAPATGVTSATFPTYAPLTAGQYEWRLFANDSWSRVATSGVITVSPSPAVLRVNGVAAPAPATVVAATQVSLSVTDSPGNAGDWVGLFPAAAADSGAGRLAYFYLNGTGSLPASGVTSATLPTSAPLTAGQYEWRLFANNGWSRITTSGVITVSASPATISVNGVTTPVVVAPGSAIMAQVADGPGNPTDWIAFAAHSALNYERIDWRYLSGSGAPPPTGLTSATLSFTAPTAPGTYELRLFPNNGVERLVTSALITVGALSTPTLSVSGGTYSSEQAVTVNSADAGVTLHYTQTGTDPTESDATSASGATITITQSSTLKVRAFKSGFAPSDIVTATYSLEVATPQISPASGTFTTPQSVAIATATAGATIRYTVDGSEPTTSSALYSQPLVIDATTTLKAKALRANWADSAVASATLTINDPRLRVIANTPAAGAVGVRNAVISATFSADMDPDSLTESTILLESVLGEWTLYTTPSYDAATRTVTLFVDDWMEPLALHRVRIVGGASGVRSATGMLLEDDFEWTFTAATDDGVSGAWGFEEGAGPTTADNSGNGNTGTLLGPSWNAGRYGGGLAFDGVDDRVRVADADTLDASTAVSITAWIKPSGLGPLSVILAKESLAADHSYALWLNSSGQLSANFVLSDGTFAATTTDAIATNVWTYVVATYDGSMIRLYVNGAEAASSAASGTFENTTRPLWIGGDQSEGHYFAGHIDEVRLFDYAMPEWEISYWLSAPVKPVQSAGRAAGGEGHTLIVKADGTVWAWGENGDGQLGDGGTADRKSPYQVPGLSNIVAVAAGRNHSMALAADGTAYAWGGNASGQIGSDTEGADQLTPLALPLTSIKAIDAGDLFSLVLRTNGEVYALGRNADGQFGVGSTALAVAAPTLVATDVIAIAAGFNHSVIVKSDGTVWTAGLNDSGQLGNNSTTPSTSWVQMTDVATGVAAAAGAGHTVVLLADGTMMAAGLNTSGQLGDSTTESMRTIAVPLSYLEGVTVIEAGADHTIATTSDGTAWTWGANTSGQLGNNSTTFSNEPLWQPFWTAHVSAGYQHSIAVTPSGTVYTWGSNSHGQLGNGVASAVARLAPTEVSADDYAWRVATPAFSPDGGSFDNDQLVTLTSSTPDEPGLPVTIRYTLDGEDPTESSPVAAGPVTVDHSLVMKARAWKGNMAASPVNSTSFTFQAAQPTVGTPAGTYTSALDDVQFLSATQGVQIRYTTNLTDPTASSTLYTGPIDIAHTTTYRIAAFKTGYAPSAVTLAHYTMNFGTLSAPVVEPAAGTYLGSVTITTSTVAPGIVYYTANPATTAGDVPDLGSFSMSPVTLTTTTTIRARSIHPDYTTSADTTRTYIIKANKPTLSATGGSYAPGSVVTITADQPSVDILRMTIDGSEPSDLSPSVVSGSSILLGNFTLKVRAFRDHPDDIDSDTEAAEYTLTSPLGPGSASAGGAHSLIATPDGRVYAWGRNANGQLGIDSTSDTSTPTLLNGITGLTSVSSGAAHSLARTWDGQVYSWGSNGSGRLGDGTTTQSTAPIHVSTLTNVVTVAAGDTHSLALTSDGRVYAWGENSDGQLGLGATFDTWTPMLINPLTNVVAIAAGGTHSLAVTASGQLYAWGNNASARLGDGTATDRTSPVLIGVSDVVAIAAGGAHSVAMTSSGALYSWGLGTSGQLGHGATASSTTPQLIQGVHANAIAAGGSHSAAIRHDGVLIAWGAGTSGQIGDGATSQRNAPVVVSGPPSVSTLTLGSTHSMAVTPAGGIWTWGEVDFGRLGDASAQDRITPATIAPTVVSWAPAAPTVDVASGTFAAAQTVTILSSETGSVIRYTLNGTEPTDSDPEVPVGGVLDISSPSQLRAKVYAIDRAASAMARANYVLQPAAPIIDPPGGSYLTTQTVTIWGSGPSSIVRYTLDASDPTTTSTLYEVPFQVSVTTVVKAREFPANGWNPSATSTSSLVFNGGAMDLPTASPAGGIFLTAPQVALSSTPGASIKYTLNGQPPTVNSLPYNGPITLPAAGATLKSKAFHPTLPASDARTDVYVVDTAAPTISATRFPLPLGQWQRTAVTVTFVCADNVGISSCSPPETFDLEGAAQTVTGIAVDQAGRQATRQEAVNVDLTPPVVTLTSPVDGQVTSSASVVVTGAVSDALSGLASTYCNGVATPVVDGLVSCTVPLLPGRNTVTLSARDGAGHGASMGVTVTRAGTPTRITLSPASVTQLLAEPVSLTLRDDFGLPTAGATWYSSSPWVISVSTDDPPVLTAVGAGTATITAIKNGVFSSATITVLADETMPAGTSRWTVPPPPTPNTTWIEGPIYTHRIDESVPDFFMVETSTSTWQRNLRAMSASGEVDWLAASPGVPLMGDTFGGVIAGIEPSPNYCVAGFYEFQRCYTGLARFAGPAGTAPWRYDSTGLLDRPAQGPDGTVYVIEHTGDWIYYPNNIGYGYSGYPGEKALVILDGATGFVTARVPLAGNGNYAPHTIGPIVAADGFGYLLVTRGGQITLLKLSREGPLTFEVIVNGEWCTPSVCRAPTPYQLLPDGLGGLLITANWSMANQSTFDLRLTRLAADGGRTDTPIDSGTSANGFIEMIGQGGTAYLRETGGALTVSQPVMDIATWTPRWYLPVEWSLVVATPDGGAVAKNAAGDHARFDGTGQLIETTPLVGLYNPVQESGGWIGVSGTAPNTPVGIRKVEGPVDDATRWDARQRVKYTTDKPAQGNRQGNLAQRNPGRGIFAKAHRVAGFTSYFHISIWAAIDKNDPRAASGGVFVNEDQFENKYVTIGGAPTGFLPCTGNLKSDLNRASDVSPNPRLFKVPLAYDLKNEASLISDLLAKDAAYGDALPYACFPDNNPDYYNSNSFAAGLLSVTGLSRPSQPDAYRGQFPGWWKPVPPSAFGQ